MYQITLFRPTTGSLLTIKVVASTEEAAIAKAMSNRSPAWRVVECDVFVPFAA